MVIDDLDLMGIAVLPMEANTLLLVDPDAVLTAPATLERLQAIARRNPQIVEGDCAVEHSQLAPRNGLNTCRQPPGGRPAPDLFSFPVDKVPDHGKTITAHVI